MRAFLFFGFLTTHIFAVNLEIDWQAHRGARGIYPENTIGGMEVAVQYPVKTLELDVIISKDKQVVVSHEPWMNEEICIGAKGREQNLYKMDYHEIVKWDCGSKVHPRFPHQKKVVVGKPLLTELLRATKGFKKAYNIEIKSTPEDERDGFQPNYKEFTDLVIKAIRSELTDNRFMIQSFDWRVLTYMREAYPGISLSALSEERFTPDEVIKKIGFAPEVYSPDYKLIDANIVKSFHDKRIFVIPWTVNTVDEMRLVKTYGVAGIITDYPNLIPIVEKKLCPPKTNSFEGKCVPLPKHAVPSDVNPGWVCGPGYQQKRFNCVKIQIPKHAHFLEDGKTWRCDEGWHRYRGTCKRGVNPGSLE